MYKVLDLHSREVLDSRWNPTVEVEITVTNEEKWIAKWIAIVPSWASTWIHEAIELRDKDPNRYLWKWVLKAVNNVNETIKNKILEQEFKDFYELDKELINLDWTKNKWNLWANAILWVSMAFIDACAKVEWKQIYDFLSNWEGRVLPYPMMNILNWGQHASNDVDIQEFMIVPIWAKNIKEAIRMWSEVFHNLWKILKSEWLFTWVWDEWWYAPNLKSNEDAFIYIIKAIEKSWYTTNEIKLAIDAAASEFYSNWIYNLKWEWKKMNSEELVNFYKEFVNKYPIISIEDWLAEDDFDWRKLFQKTLWNKIMNVWDDLLVTNIERIQMWIDNELCNSVLIKLNQIWTVSETIQAIKLSHENNLKTIVSHRSWETENTFIADLVVAMNSWFIKTWSLSRTDRISKYNQLIRIEERLWKKSRFGE